MKKILLSLKTEKAFVRISAIVFIVSLSIQTLWAQKQVQLSQSETHLAYSYESVAVGSQENHVQPNHVLCDSVVVDSIDVSDLGGCTFQFEAINAQNVTSFAWTFGDGSANITSPVVTHSYLSNGTYHVQLIIANGCSADTLYTTVSCSDSGTKVEPVDTKQSLLHIYPNPVSNILTLQYPSGMKGQINISDLSGRMIQTKAIPASAEPDIIRLNVSKLAPGMYFLSLINGKERRVTKFVKK